MGRTSRSKSTAGGSARTGIATKGRKKALNRIANFILRLSYREGGARATPLQPAHGESIMISFWRLTMKIAIPLLLMLASAGFAAPPSDDEIRQAVERLGHEKFSERE